MSLSDRKNHDFHISDMKAYRQAERASSVRDGDRAIVFETLSGHHIVDEKIFATLAERRVPFHALNAQPVLSPSRVDNERMGSGSEWLRHAERAELRRLFSESLSRDHVL